MIIRIFCLLFLLLPACGMDPAAAPDGQAASSEPRAAASPGRFDPLTIRLEMKATSVPSGGQVGSVLVVENRSGETVVDPGCVLGAGRYALVPADDPDAELWLQPVVDCQGPFEMPPGFREEYGGTTFPARTKYGEDLPPGDYLATLEIDGYSHRLGQSIEVTE